jgi:predicted flap endonuclease-1-like 5' DNA nuclease
MHGLETIKLLNAQHKRDEQRKADVELLRDYLRFPVRSTRAMWLAQAAFNRLHP